VHARLVGSAPALLTVAGNAASDDIAPLRLPSPGAWNHMVAGEVFVGKPPPAILAAMVVAGVDVSARKLGVAPSETNKSHQSNDRRDAYCDRDGMDLAVRLFYNLNLLHEDELNRPLPIDHVERFKRGVEQKDLFEESLLSIRAAEYVRTGMVINLQRGRKAKTSPSASGKCLSMAVSVPLPSVSDSLGGITRPVWERREAMRYPAMLYRTVRMFAAAGAMIACLYVSPARAQAPEPDSSSAVYVGVISGAIGPAARDYIHRVLSESAVAGANCTVILLDTQ
jgi:hypothetical protein